MHVLTVSGMRPSDNWEPARCLRMHVWAIQGFEQYFAQNVFGLYGHELLVVLITVVVHARIMEEGWTNHFPSKIHLFIYLFICLFKWGLTSAQQLHSLGEEWDHSGSGRWDDCGRAFPWGAAFELVSLMGFHTVSDSCSRRPMIGHCCQYQEDVHFGPAVG